MNCDDAADDDADFQRWYFGGSPPESDSWPRHAFEEAFRGGTTAGVAPPHCAPSGHEAFAIERPAQFALA